MNSGEIKSYDVKSGEIKVYLQCELCSQLESSFGVKTQDMTELLFLEFWDHRNFHNFAVNFWEKINGEKKFAIVKMARKSMAKN